MGVSLVQRNFQLNKIPTDILEEIKKYCKQFSNSEACGIIHETFEGLRFLACENCSPDARYNFSIDPRILIDYNVQYIVHSHTICSAKPSINDMKNSDESCIPYLIYSLRDDDFYLYENVGV